MSDVDEAINLVNECLKQRAECMKKPVYVNKCKRKKDWYDQECNCARKHVRKLLRKKRKTLKKHNEGIRICCNYRHRKDFNDTIVNELIRYVKDQQAFWITVRNFQVETHNHVIPLLLRTGSL